MKTVINTLAVAVIGHIIIMNTGVFLSGIARKEKVQNTKIGSLLYGVMHGASSATFAYGVMVDPTNSQEDVDNFFDDYLTNLLEQFDK